VTPTAAHPSDTLQVFFLAAHAQPPTAVATRLADFLRGAESSLDLALYDFRLSDSLKTIITAALHERARAGVAIRIVYDADKPETPRLEAGMDPAPAGTGAFVQALGYPWRRIAGLKLMHHKYIVRDAGRPAAAVWTGSTNVTDDAWTLQENNIVQLFSPAPAAAYARDFNDLWSTGVIENSGAFDPTPNQLTYAGAPATIQVLFSPGRGPAIDFDIAHHVARAQHRVRLCSMLLNSSALLSALSDLLRCCRPRVEVSGIYDRTQMQAVLEQWRDVRHNHWKIGAVRDIVADARLVGKHSTPYSPHTPHDFMHNKALVVDDTVITGSYNFSRSAELNAENILLIDSPALAETYSAYIDHLMALYQHDSVGDIGV
jgi:phosphatidylserine/phosphatidylglycerophosphate/cardiolipin synthase-like enzyme